MVPDSTASLEFGSRRYDNGDSSSQQVDDSRLGNDDKPIIGKPASVLSFDQGDRNFERERLWEIINGQKQIIFQLRLQIENLMSLAFGEQSINPLRQSSSNRSMQKNSFTRTSDIRSSLSVEKNILVPLPRLSSFAKANKEELGDESKVPVLKDGTPYMELLSNVLVLLSALQDSDQGAAFAADVEEGEYGGGYKPPENEEVKGGEIHDKPFKKETPEIEVNSNANRYKEEDSELADKGSGEKKVDGKKLAEEKSESKNLVDKKSVEEKSVDKKLDGKMLGDKVSENKLVDEESEEELADKVNEKKLHEKANEIPRRVVLSSSNISGASSRSTPLLEPTDEMDQESLKPISILPSSSTLRTVNTKQDQIYKDNQADKDKKTSKTPLTQYPTPLYSEDREKNGAFALLWKVLATEKIVVNVMLSKKSEKGLSSSQTGQSPRTPRELFIFEISLHKDKVIEETHILTTEKSYAELALLHLYVRQSDKNRCINELDSINLPEKKLFFTHMKKCLNAKLSAISTYISSLISILAKNDLTSLVNFFLKDLIWKNANLEWLKDLQINSDGTIISGNLTRLTRTLKIKKQKKFSLTCSGVFEEHVQSGNPEISMKVKYTDVLPLTFDIIKRIESGEWVVETSVPNKNENKEPVEFPRILDPGYGFVIVEYKKQAFFSKGGGIRKLNYIIPQSMVLVRHVFFASSPFDRDIWVEACCTVISELRPGVLKEVRNEEADILQNDRDILKKISSSQSVDRSNGAGQYAKIHGQSGLKEAQSKEVLPRKPASVLGTISYSANSAESSKDSKNYVPSASSQGYKYATIGENSDSQLGLLGKQPATTDISFASGSSKHSIGSKTSKRTGLDPGEGRSPTKDKSKSSIPEMGTESSREGKSSSEQNQSANSDTRPHKASPKSSKDSHPDHGDSHSYREESSKDHDSPYNKDEKAFSITRSKSSHNQRGSQEIRESDDFRSKDNDASSQKYKTVAGVAERKLNLPKMGISRVHDDDNKVISLPSPPVYKAAESETSSLQNSTKSNGSDTNSLVQNRSTKSEERPKSNRITLWFSGNTKKAKNIFQSAHGKLESKGNTIPSRMAFGVPLETVPKILCMGNISIPSPVYRCIEYLEARKALSSEGLYRLSGSSAVIKTLKDKFDTYGDYNISKSRTYYDVHAVASLLKLYFRELPTPILTTNLQKSFLGVLSIEDKNKKITELFTLISSLPPENYIVLKCLISHLVRVIKNSQVNKMNLRNICIVFSPTVKIPAGILSLMVVEYYKLFLDPKAEQKASLDDIPLSNQLPAMNNATENSITDSDEHHKDEYLFGDINLMTDRSLSNVQE